MREIETTSQGDFGSTRHFIVCHDDGREPDEATVPGNTPRRWLLPEGQSPGGWMPPMMRLAPTLGYQLDPPALLAPGFLRADFAIYEAEGRGERAIYGAPGAPGAPDVTTMTCSQARLVRRVGRVAEVMRPFAVDLFEAALGLWNEGMFDGLESVKAAFKAARAYKVDGDSTDLDARHASVQSVWTRLVGAFPISNVQEIGPTESAAALAYAATTLTDPQFMMPPNEHNEAFSFLYALAAEVHTGGAAGEDLIPYFRWAGAVLLSHLDPAVSPPAPFDGEALRAKWGPLGPEGYRHGYPNAASVAAIADLKAAALGRAMNQLARPTTDGDGAIPCRIGLVRRGAVMAELYYPINVDTPGLWEQVDHLGEAVAADAVLWAAPVSMHDANPDEETEDPGEPLCAPPIISAIAVAVAMRCPGGRYTTHSEIYGYHIDDDGAVRWVEDDDLAACFLPEDSDIMCELRAACRKGAGPDQPPPIQTEHAIAAIDALPPGVTVMASGLLVTSRAKRVTTA